MQKSQVISNLRDLLSGVTSTERAGTALQRAERRAGLSHATSIDRSDLNHLLAALAAEGGPIQEIAIQVAMNGLDAPAGDRSPFDRPAA